MSLRGSETKAKRWCAEWTASVVGLSRFSPNLPQKLLSMSLAVASGIFDDEIGIEGNIFFLLVLPYVLLFFGGCIGPSRVTSRLLLDLEPGVDTIGKESLFALIGWEVMNFVDLDNSVSQCIPVYPKKRAEILCVRGGLKN